MPQAHACWRDRLLASPHTESQNPNLGGSKQQILKKVRYSKNASRIQSKPGGKRGSQRITQDKEVTSDRQQRAYALYARYAVTQGLAQSRLF